MKGCANTLKRLIFQKISSENGHFLTLILLTTTIVVVCSSAYRFHSRIMVKGFTSDSGLNVVFMGDDSPSSFTGSQLRLDQVQL